MADAMETIVTKEPEVMRVPEVVALLGVDRKTVYAAVRRGEIPHRRIGSGRSDGGVILFLRSTVMHWLSGIDEYPQRKISMSGNYVTKRADELGIPVIESRVPVRVTVTSRDVPGRCERDEEVLKTVRVSSCVRSFARGQIWVLFPHDCLPGIP